MYSEELEQIIDAALADGTLTAKERAVLHKRAKAEGVDLDEFDVVIEGRLAKMKNSANLHIPPPPKSTQNEKLGNVVKCPNCGAPVPGGSAVCKVCGYTFQNVKANSSIERLQQKLEEFNIRQEIQRQKFTSDDFSPEFEAQVIASKMDLISAFPVPNTRADLLEFLSFLQGKSNSIGPRNGGREGNNFSYAYWLLFSNCVEKAKINFADDQAFVSFFDKHEKEVKKSKSLLGWVIKMCQPKPKSKPKKYLSAENEREAMATKALVFLIIFCFGMALLLILTTK